MTNPKKALSVKKTVQKNQSKVPKKKKSNLPLSQVALNGQKNTVPREYKPIPMIRRSRPTQNVRTPFHVYRTDPFFTERRIRVFQGCHSTHLGAKDLGFDGIPIGEPVYASEGGTVIFLRTGSPPCGNPPFRPCPRNANGVGIRSDIDQYITYYFHVTPRSNLRIGDRVPIGRRIGSVDISGVSSGPHVHMSRFTPAPNSRPTCNWAIRGVDSPQSRKK